MMTLATELQARSNKVTFLTFKGRGLGEHVRTAGFQTNDVRVRLKIDPAAILKIARHIRREGIDIVHCHLSTSAINGALAARLAGVPSVSTVHGMSGKLSFLPSTHLIAVSGEVRRHLVGQGIHESRISIVPNGIEVPDWSSDRRVQARKSLGIPLDVPVIGTTARLTELKGINHALYAVSQIREDMPNIRYVVFGDGQQREELQTIAQSLGITENVMWMGYRNDVQNLLPALDIFLFPSLREAMGISIVEAMAAKIPTIATTIGGIPEVVTSDVGILVPPADPVAMSEAVISLLRDPAKRAELGSRAWERAQSEFSAQKMAARTLGVYAALLEKSCRV